MATNKVCDLIKIANPELANKIKIAKTIDYTKLGKAFDSQDENLASYLEKIEIEILNNSLERSGGCKTQAAKSLGISFRSLRYRLKKYNITHMS